MPKQKTVKASKRGGRGAGAGRGGRKKSAPPASEEPSDGPTPALIVRLRVPVASLPVDDAVPTPDINHDEDKDDVGTQSAVVKTRSGRAVKPKKDNTYVWGDDLSSQLASSPANRASDEIGESTYQYRGRTSTPAILTFPPQPQSQPITPNRRPSKRAPPKPTLFHPSLSSVPEVPNYQIPLDIQTRATNILTLLTASPKIHIDLPLLSHADDTEQPYSPALLTALYIRAYSSQHWDVCDLVADTWIRAFHCLRRREERSGVGKRGGTWRYNAPLTKRREGGRKGCGEDGPVYESVLVTQDPELEHSVTYPSAELLNALFAHTSKECGVRALWADAIALTGDRFEVRFKAAGRRGEKWHPELRDEVMCTALRMVGRKLTLKIEEAGEGVWCRRYHEHGRRGEGKCYRERAYERKLAGLDEEEVVSDEDEGDAAGEKMEGVEGGREGTGNRVRFEAEPEVEVFDDDAEGETEDE